jgi:3-hydroxyacyl-[acyl-carrier-protein] dehydratase
MRFIMVDEIVSMLPGKTIHGIKTLHADDDLFRDHFPGFPVVPGVLLIEMMAQTAGKCFDAEDPARGKAMLVQVRKASFRRWVRPDEAAQIFAEIKASAPTFGSAQCRIAIAGEHVAEAVLLFSFVPRATLADDFRVEVLARYMNRQVRTPTGDT